MFNEHDGILSMSCTRTRTRSIRSSVHYTLKERGSVYILYNLDFFVEVGTLNIFTPWYMECNICVLVHIILLRTHKASSITLANLI